ncbi:HAMP domain-containing sensor histidine kinase [Natranaerofaba carboxydovora]|uniref:HAMP domain-containing sensor histidine kinase n=1 Tax=Natranaerofaba carboxydovora TaxID=2742683 RepID=UPI001F12DB16|nr:ATP-binding protein [Natranaerofaba carboxydovora]UMZ74251.1 Sensor histidine kinase ResE [Natranaerofaba carboxydovora]
MKIFNSIKGKINTAFIFLLVLSLVFVAAYLFYYFNNFYMDNLEHQLTQKARMITVSIKDDLENKEGLQQYVLDLKDKTDDFRFTIIRNDGLVLAESETAPELTDNHIDRPEVKDVLDGKIGVNIRYSNTLNKDLLYVAHPVSSPDSDEIDAISRVAIPLEQIQEARFNMALFITSSVLFTLFVAWIFGTLISRNITHPLDSLTKWSKQLAKGDFSHEFPVKSKDEVGQLAHHFHEMKVNLSELMDSLTEEKNKLAVLLNYMPDGVIGVDTDKNITLINPAAKNLFRIKGDLLNRPLISVTRNYTLYNNLQKVLTENIQVSQKIILDNKVLRVYITPFHPKSNTPGGAVIILQNITDLTKLEQVRKEFISNISHELKTPLTSVQGFIETLHEEFPEDNHQHKEFLDIIKEETRRMKRLIDDLTILSKLETKPGFVQPAKEELNSLIKRIISLAKERWTKHNYKIKSTLPSKEVTVLMDKDKIQQALTNLIDNAAKHNPSDTTVTLKTELNKNRTHVKISVEDDGMGIPEEELPRIFERFYRLEKSRYKDDLFGDIERSHSGTGLGLSIAKHIIEAHNSSLEVKSQIGKGTEFYFYLEIS